MSCQWEAPLPWGCLTPRKPKRHGEVGTPGHSSSWVHCLATPAVCASHDKWQHRHDAEAVSPVLFLNSQSTGSMRIINTTICLEHLLQNAILPMLLHSQCSVRETATQRWGNWVLEGAHALWQVTAHRSGGQVEFHAYSNLMLKI